MPEMLATIWLVANLRISLGGSSGGNPYPAGICADRRAHGESGIRPRRTEKAVSARAGKASAGKASAGKASAGKAAFAREPPRDSDQTRLDM
jgi:hypothetical protein